MHNSIIEQQYNLISLEFDKSRVRIWNNVKEFLLKNNTNYNLLDVGCGNGKNMVYAKNLNNNKNIIGFDISENLLNICKKKNLNVYKQDICLPFNDIKYTNILCIAVIHHLLNIDEQKKAIINMFNCLDKNGSLLISVWAYEIGTLSTFRKFENIGANVIKWNGKFDRFYYIHTFKTFQKMINELQKIIYFNYYITWERQNWFATIYKLSE
jgi:ubiquinone/menaquinone biosynthesis C-methylase UbiE